MGMKLTSQKCQTFLKIKFARDRMKNTPKWMGRLGTHMQHIRGIKYWRVRFGELQIEAWL